MSKTKMPIVRDRYGRPLRIEWKVKIPILAMIAGALFDVAVEVLLQQFGILPFTVTGLVAAIVIGIVIGFAIPNLGSGIGVAVANKKLRRLRSAPARRRTA